MIDQRVRSSGGIDTLVTIGEAAHEPKKLARPPIQAQVAEYVWAVGAVMIVTAVCWWTRSIFEVVDQAMMYLLGVLLVAARASRTPALLSAVASVAALDFFFVPPIFTFAVADLRYIVTFAVMLVVGVSVSSLTLRIRAQAEAARERERRTSAINAMVREFVVRTKVADIAESAVRYVEDLFETPAVVVLTDREGKLVPLVGSAAPLLDEREAAVMRCCFDRGRVAGYGTDTLPASRFLFMPLVGTRPPLGVFGVRCGPEKQALRPSQRELLDTLVAQTALGLERATLAEDAERTRLAVETERTRNALLSAVSHDLRTPLASITGSADALLDEHAVSPDERRDLLEMIRDEATRLATLVADLLELTRLESGAIQANKEWCPLEEIVGSALARLEKQLGGRDVEVRLPDQVLLIPVDAVLIEQVFINLLDNAAKLSAQNTPIEIRGEMRDGSVAIEISDRGPGLPPGEQDRVFEKFYRTEDGKRLPGAGLGLTVCQAIVKAHGGKIWALNRVPGPGATFTFTLPVDGVLPLIERSLDELRLLGEEDRA